MTDAQQQPKYPLVSRIFHWLLALMLTGMVAVGLYMTRQEFSPSVAELYGLHKSTGFVVLVLVALRLSWRLAFVRLPEAPAPRWQQWAARLTHYGLYALMLAIPLTGWAMSSAKGVPMSVYGLFVLPDIAPTSKELGHLFYELHEYTAYTLIGLSVVHILAALYHHFRMKDGLLRRMWLWLVVFALASGPALASDWQLLKEESYIRFTATLNGAPSRGAFEAFDADFRFDENTLLSDPGSATPELMLTVDLTQTSSAYPAVATELQKKPWFDTAGHPTATYLATAIQKVDDQTFTLPGDLTLKGRTKNVPVRLTVAREGGKVTLTGTATISRLDFNVGEGDWEDTGSLKDDVLVNFRFVLEQPE